MRVPTPTNTTFAYQVQIYRGALLGTGATGVVIRGRYHEQVRTLSQAGGHLPSLTCQASAGRHWPSTKSQRTRRQSLLWPSFAWLEIGGKVTPELSFFGFSELMPQHPPCYPHTPTGSGCQADRGQWGRQW